MTHTDILNQRDPLGKPFAGSLAAHLAIAGAVLLSYVLKPHVGTFGGDTQSSGLVGVNIVKSIPIPQRDGRVNRLAHNTQSVVPEAPLKKREVTKASPPDPRAIKIPSRTPLKKFAPENTTRNIYKPQPERTNQVTSRTPESLKSPNFAMQGANGVGVGENTSLGDHFGYYKNLMIRQIGSKWNTGGLPNDGKRVLLTFSILRDGSVEGVRVAQPSGNYALDTSAQRALMEASPLPQLPDGYKQSSAQVELWFQPK